MTIHAIPSPVEAATSSFDRTTVLRPVAADPAGPVAFARAFSASLAASATQHERQNVRPVEEVAILKSSGLVNLLIPERFGGLGGTIPQALQVLVELARGDASVGSLLGYHYTNAGVARLFDLDTDAEEIDSKSARERWFWGNISQPMARGLKATPTEDGFRLDGVKHWNTGPSVADVTTVLAHRDDVKELLYAYIPANRKGLHYRSDWDHLGLRRTETVTIDFVGVEVSAKEVFRSSFGPITSFPPLYTVIGELYFASHYLGSIYGALDAGLAYTRTETRPAPGSGVEKATKDPYILRDYGEFWSKAEAASAYLYSVAAEVQDGFERRKSITARERAVLGVKAHAVRAFITKVGLEITPRIYDVTGARSTASSYGLDRFWRDIRAHSLHDSHAYKLRAIGDYVVNGEAHEPPSFA
jgi:alkylation response protein AidB-like acyl-CoA dehydrogenase